MEKEHARALPESDSEQTQALLSPIPPYTENPLADVELEVMQTLGEYFETLIQPRTRFFRGDESDVNGDGRVTMLFSHLVNESGAYAFVSHCDLVEESVCGYSNSRELIYVAIPDPEEKINSPLRSRKSPQGGSTRLNRLRKPGMPGPLPQPRATQDQPRIAVRIRVPILDTDQVWLGRHDH